SAALQYNHAGSRQSPGPSPRPERTPVTDNVIEIELADIEDRMAGYSADAQADIRWLTRELRKVYNLGLRNAGPPSAAIYDAATGLLSGGAYGVRFSMARARA